MNAMRMIKIAFITVFLVGLYVVSLVWPGAMNGPMSIMEVNGPVAQEQATVFWYTVAVSAFLMLTVGGVFLYAIFRFRAKPGQDFKVPEQTHGSAKAEIALIVASCVLLLFIAVPNAKALFFVSEVPQEKKADAIKVIAIGHQWWWEFQYPDLGVTTANELHIPVGKAIDLEIKSADVLHAFWVPRLAGKIDAIPGQINRMWMEASEPGKYQGQCTEYCGDSHANMRFLVMSHKAEDFDNWLRNEKKDGVKPKTVEQVNGHRVFMSGCNACHAVKGSGAMGAKGPDLSHFGSRTTLGAGIYVSNKDNLTNWIKFPKQMKPGNLMNLESVNMVLSNKDVNDLVAYLESLK